MHKNEIIAGLLGAIMTLAMVASPALAAYSLGDYPAFLFTDHQADYYIVVGSKAAAEDVVGAVDVATRLAAESYVEVSTAAVTTVTGAVSEEIPLGEVIAGGAKLDTTLKHYKLEGLKDASIDFQDESYDFHEEIRLTLNSDELDVETSLTAGDDDYGSNVYLEIQKDAIRYCYVFDESINISKATQDEPLEIEFLGSTLKVTSVSDSDTFIVQIGEEYTLTVGDTVTWEGHTITLVNVGSGGTVVVEVDGVQETISQDTTETVGEVKIRPIDYFYADEKSERMATLIIGEEVSKTYNDGDAYIGENEDDPDWVWDLAGLTSTSPTLCVENDFIKDDYTDNPAGLGECYTLPNEYGKVCLDSLTVETYQTYEFEPETGIDLSDVWSGVTSAKVLTITSPGEDEGLQITPNINSNGPKTEKIYLRVENSSVVNGNVSVLYIDEDGDVTYAGSVSLDPNTYRNIAEINFQDTKAGDIYIAVKGNITANGYFYMLLNNTVISNDNIQIKWGVDSSGYVVKLGDTADTSEADELVWYTTNIGTKDEDHRTRYGILIKNPDTHGATDEVALEIPADQVKALVYVYGPGAEVTVAEGKVINKVVPITTAVAKLDKEIPDPATVDKNLVLVGGSCANSLVQKLVDAGKLDAAYTCEGGVPGEGWKTGEGYIWVIEDAFRAGQTVVVAAGTDAADTRKVCLVLQQYATLLAGRTETAIKITEVSAAGIAALE